MDLLALFLRFADQGRQTQFVGRGVEHLARQPVFTYQDTAGGVLRRIAPVDQDSFKTGNIQQTRQIAAESRRTVDDHFVTASRNGRRSGDFRLLLQIAYPVLQRITKTGAADRQAPDCLRRFQITTL